MYVHIFACLHEICFYYIFIFSPYLNKNLVVNGKKNSTRFDRCNAFIRVQLLAIIFQVSVFLLWELYSFHDTNRTSSKDQNPTCKHTGQRKGWGDGGGKCHIYQYLFRPVSITISPNHCTDNETPFCSPFRYSLGWCLFLILGCSGWRSCDCCHHRETSLLLGVRGQRSAGSREYGE